MEKELEDFIREAHTFLPIDLEDREVFLERLESFVQSYGDKRAEDVKARIRKVINPVNEILN